MLSLLRPAALRRLLPPSAGAVANAREAMGALALAADERHELAVVQATALGVDSWEALPGQAGPGAHALHVSSDDADLVARLASFVVEGLADGQVCVVAATAQHLTGLRHRLDLAGLTAEAERLLVAVDADGQLERVLREDRPDPALFELHVGRPLRRRVQSGQRPRVAGEMAGTLVGRRDLAGALEVEQLWHALQRELAFPLLCVYPPLDDERFLAQAHGEHTHALPSLGG
ncbi:MAG: response regulator [Frankiales bacterium]|nr:response regulator [Frankiales bacterium]